MSRLISLKIALIGSPVIPLPIMLSDTISSNSFIPPGPNVRITILGPPIPPPPKPPIPPINILKMSIGLIRMPPLPIPAFPPIFTNGLLRFASYFTLSFGSLNILNASDIFWNFSVDSWLFPFLSG